MTIFEKIERILIDATEAMLQSHDRPARTSNFGAEYDENEAAESFATVSSASANSGPNVGDVVVATIGFAADGGRGSITLVSPFVVVDALRPAGIDSSEALICDFFGELANMLLGRLKNQLLRRGITLFVGLPTKGLARTMRLQRNSEDGARSVWHRFDVDEGALFLRLDAKFDPEIVLTGSDEDDHDDDDDSADHASTMPDAIGAEGEMMFFDGGL